jgi:RES domain-containing protein
VGDLTVWRLTKAKHATSAFSGYGSTLRAGRWHPRGCPVVYCAASPSLALIETLVHAERADLLRFEYVAIPVTFGIDLLERMEAENLPPDWRTWPHPASTQAIGAGWFDAQRSVVLEVPSAVVPHERNYLVNPLHPRFREVRVGAPEPFPVDPRLSRE